MTNAVDIERQLRRKARQDLVARNAAAREAALDARFQATRDRFHKNVAYWNEFRDHPPKTQTLRVHRDALHRRILWTANDALNWTRRDDGTFILAAGKIDELHRPMTLLLQFVKAEHKIGHDRAMREMRDRHFQTRHARAASPKKEEKILESAERPLTPELSD